MEKSCLLSVSARVEESFEMDDQDLRETPDLQLLKRANMFLEVRVIKNFQERRMRARVR